MHFLVINIYIYIFISWLYLCLYESGSTAGAALPLWEIDKGLYRFGKTDIGLKYSGSTAGAALPLWENDKGLYRFGKTDIGLKYSGFPADFL